MKKKYIISALLLAVCVAVCVVCCVFYVRQGEQTDNRVFTDAFFKNMVFISPFGNYEVRLEGQAAESVASYLKGIQLEPADGTPIPGDPSEDPSEMRIGGNQGYLVYYQNGESVHFNADGSTLTLLSSSTESETYQVVDKDGRPISEFGETVWHFFHPEV